MQSGLVRDGGGQRLALLRAIESQDLHRHRGAGVLPFVHLSGRLLEGLPRRAGDGGFPVRHPPPGALEEVGELLPCRQMFPGGRPGATSATTMTASLPSTPFLG